MADCIISLFGVHLAPGIRSVTPRTANAMTGINSQPIHHQRLSLKDMPRFLSTGSLKISCVKITASSGMSMAPALKSKPFIAASGSMAEDSSGSPTAEAPLKCITSPTITIGRNAHSRKTISFFVFISLSKFRFI